MRTWKHLGPVSDHHTGLDHHMRVNNDPVADLCALPDHTKLADGHILANLPRLYHCMFADHYDLPRLMHLSASSGRKFA